MNSLSPLNFNSKFSVNRLLSFQSSSGQPMSQPSSLQVQQLNDDSQYAEITGEFSRNDKSKAPKWLADLIKNADYLKIACFIDVLGQAIRLCILNLVERDRALTSFSTSLSTAISIAFVYWPSALIGRSLSTPFAKKLSEIFPNPTETLPKIQAILALLTGLLTNWTVQTPLGAKLESYFNKQPWLSKVAKLFFWKGSEGKLTEPEVMNNKVKFDRAKMSQAERTFEKRLAHA